ncbi:MAG TPA: cell division protein FtsB [Burkholderiaceae bacterium]|nr:cell division protein FtsB [Burkholderiaceae bacterium]
MRFLFAVLFVLSLVIQYPLWWGEGGWLRVRQLEKTVADRQAVNSALKARNNALAAEVADLQDGSRAIEERARMEQGMLHEEEIFVRLLTRPEAQTQHSDTPQAGSSGEVTGN